MRRDILVANVGTCEPERDGNKHPKCPGWACFRSGKPVVSGAKPACVIPQDALNDTRDSETKLEASQGVCNETMMPSGMNVSLA